VVSGQDKILQQKVSQYRLAERLPTVEYYVLQTAFPPNTEPSGAAATGCLRLHTASFKLLCFPNMAPSGAAAYSCILRVLQTALYSQHGTKESHQNEDPKVSNRNHRIFECVGHSQHGTMKESHQNEDPRVSNRKRLNSSNGCHGGKWKQAAADHSNFVPPHLLMRRSPEADARWC
jgi:hypothetical protein